ncbi:MAG: hypothetical protein LJE93_04705 [Acidobacteria bacterium]|jgi:hypothetical protein|nr:hypothetical protein [Acidobacteriota bacterium]
MNKPVVLLVVGVMLSLISLTADVIGIGEGTGIGWRQITGFTVGLVIAVIGLVQMRKKG